MAKSVSYTCKTCGFTAKNKAGLSSHMRSHKTAKKTVKKTVALAKKPIVKVTAKKAPAKVVKKTVAKKTPVVAKKKADVEAKKNVRRLEKQQGYITLQARLQRDKKEKEKLVPLATKQQPNLCTACNALPIGAVELVTILLVMVFALTAILLTSVYALEVQADRIVQLESQVL